MIYRAQNKINNDLNLSTTYMGKVGSMIVEATKALTIFITRCSSDSSGQNSAQQQSYSENSQLHLDQEQLRESLKKITFFSKLRGLST